MTGPVTGTPFPSSSDTSVVILTAAPATPVGDGHTHGLFGAYLKFAGYDGIIIKGAARNLFISGFVIVKWRFEMPLISGQGYP